MEEVKERMTAIARFAAITVSLALATAMAPAPPPHTDWVTMRRGTCTYVGRSDHTYASTQKTRGGCLGHAWVRLQRRDGALSRWHHAPGFKKISTKPGRLSTSFHKGWGNGKVYRIRHY
ncbi:hypothetical protein CDO52_08460 [Nocardiopsis gilva YIM 90087]|uniref:Streptomyces killer toxin-like beta/gamma crystallin domain-containing protein n=2 Tax=Nocardiopsis gilva TaxID=280236 RepID=A0A223S459_9ACTN|nr:hypothetical protein CDO52_08460 [Nocardiopsis gilva YIM 90087]